MGGHIRVVVGFGDLNFFLVVRGFLNPKILALRTGQRKLHNSIPAVLLTPLILTNLELFDASMVFVHLEVGLVIPLLEEPPSMSDWFLDPM